MKFLLDAERSAQVKSWAREHLDSDAHCNSESDDSYDINTLYLDTPELDLFHRTGVVGNSKHRIRRYGNDAMLWLETKRKKQLVVRKNRTPVSPDDLTPRLTAISAGTADQASPNTEHPAWCGDWFLQRVTERHLLPAIQIAYRRFARTRVVGQETLRLTIDSQMKARPIDGWNVATESGAPLCPAVSFGHYEVLELKFHDQMPSLFKQLLTQFVIPGTGFSKYRAALVATDIVPEIPHSLYRAIAAAPQQQHASEYTLDA
ncbi:polyphosphate polymerase domain-containing protein [Stieleria tagensis]|uniref:polyphosphate polymerase domain-containing protein n=1 Tax=Stieleria tagensis TaxID=2956795 RepID=UPI00209B3934|nr:polyphosphate polymerase domain-containing protein [Stieleria tagensis]